MWQLRKPKSPQCCCSSGLHVLCCDGGTREKRLTGAALDHPTLESFPHQTCKRKKETSCPHLVCLSVLWTDLDCDRHLRHQQHNVVDCSLRNRDCVRACGVCVCVRGWLKIAVWWVLTSCRSVDESIPTELHGVRYWKTVICLLRKQIFRLACKKEACPK